MYIRQHRGSRRRGPGRTALAGSDIDAAAAGTGMTPVFQPIVSLPAGETVGYEALARWPGLRDCSPDRVFSHASDIGTADALDRVCIDSAITVALSLPLRRGTLLCINAEPSTPYVGCTNDAILARGHDELTVMFEITERNLLAHPHALLRKIAAMRSDGFMVALDDVGAQPDSLALLDVILPDVIKLDLAMVQTQPSHAQARTLAAVLAHHERTDAVILAEGIESELHREQALAVGATLGQGYLYGHPGPLDTDVATAWAPVKSEQHPHPATRSPFDLVAGTTPVRTARKQTLIALSRHIESHAERATDPPMMFTALQRDEYFTGATRERYRQLARRSPLVSIFGERLPDDLGSGVRGVELQPSDPLCAEWTVISLGPQNATALIARERDAHHDNARREEDRRFDFVITYNRPLVTAAVRGLLERMR